MNTFYFEVTDTFGGELNYCWLNRFVIKAKSLRGALNKLSRHTGLKFRNNGLYFKAKHACIGAYEYPSECDIPDENWLNRAEII